MSDSPRFQIGQQVQADHRGVPITGRVVGLEPGRHRRGRPDVWLYLVQPANHDGALEIPETQVQGA